MLSIALTLSQSSTYVLSNHSASHTDYYASCITLSFAPTAPVLPPGNPALSFYIPRSDYGLYYCFPLSALINTPSLSDCALPYLFRKGLYLPRFQSHRLFSLKFGAGGFSFCSLLFLGIKKPHPLDLGFYLPKIIIFSLNF